MLYLSVQLYLGVHKDMLPYPSEMNSPRDVCSEKLREDEDESRDRETLQPLSSEGFKIPLGNLQGLPGRPCSGQGWWVKVKFFQAKGKSFSSLSGRHYSKYFISLINRSTPDFMVTPSVSIFLVRQQWSEGCCDSPGKRCQPKSE